jgi:cold shock protein
MSAETVMSQPKTPVSQAPTVQSNGEPNDTPKLPLTPEACVPELRVTGHVKFFDDLKGFGFISRTNGEDVFVHHSGIVGKGYRLWTTERGSNSPWPQGPKGLYAKDVIPLKE